MSAGLCFKTILYHRDSGDITAMLATSISTTSFLRLKVDNAFDSELIDLAAPLPAEFYKSATFVTNTNDDCTMLSLAPEVDVSNPASGTRNGDQSMIIGAGTTGVTSGDPSLTSGVDSMIVSAPLTGSTGFVDMLVDVVAGSKSGCNTTGTGMAITKVTQGAESESVLVSSPGALLASSPMPACPQSDKGSERS